MSTSPFTLPLDCLDGPESTPCALLLHAFPFDRRMWRHVAPRLRARRTVLCPDLRGFGQSSSLRAPRSLDEHADDLARTLDQHSIPQVSVVGLSMGGYVALAFAERHPSRIAQLVLVDSRASADSEDAKQARQKSMAIVSSQGVAALYDGLEPRLFSAEPLPQAKDMMRSIAVAQSRDGVLAALAAMRDRPDRTALWSALEVPTLCVVGRHDALTPPSEMQALADRARDGRCVVLEHSGHLPCAEEPERLAEILDRFLA
jgi:3-oxoadipate enol-lactonase